MLTKEERKEIAERLSSVTELGDRAFYEAITGEQRPDTTSYEEDLKAMFNAVINLCDTSNMVELPRDKDGQVILIGDTVYDEAKRKLEVDSIRFCQNGVQVVVAMRGEYNNLTYYPSELTHKSPVTAQELSDYMQAVINEYGSDISNTPYVKLLDIANQLKELASKDE